MAEVVAPIVVCSKGRPASCPTIKALIQSELDWKVTLEAEDVESYVNHGLPLDRILKLPESDRGIWYTRRYALEHFRASQTTSPWLWMLDDDISDCCSVKNGLSTRCSLAEALSGAQTLFCSDPSVALGALEYKQFAWSSKSPVKYNGYADVAVCFHLNRTRLLSHRDGTKEDRDFAMQVIASGFRVARVQRFSFQCPSIGSNKGGLHEWYSERSNLELVCRRMLQLWGPEFITIVEKLNGLPDCKINWRKLSNPPEK